MCCGRWALTSGASRDPSNRDARHLRFGTARPPALPLLTPLLSPHRPFRDLSTDTFTMGIQKGVRPKCPKKWPPALTQLLGECWLGEPEKRPEMKDIIPRLREVRNGPQTARIASHTARSLAHPAHTARVAPPAQVLAGLEVESGAKAGRRSSQPGMSTSPP